MSNRKSVFYAGGGDEVGKESASEYCSIGKATENILEKHQLGDTGDTGDMEILEILENLSKTLE